jgi:ferritin-like metal-binding protein YciE
MASMNTMNDLFVHSLRDVYDAEEQLIQALPKMEKAAGSAQLKSAFRTHLQQTENQKKRLEQVFQQMGMRASGVTCKGMQGLIKEGEEVISMGGEPEVKDAALIGAAQKVEHYEISAYGTLRTLAGKLGMMEAKALLQQTLDEEGATDHLLTQIAEGTATRTGINEKAMTATGND